MRTRELKQSKVLQKRVNFTFSWNYLCSDFCKHFPLLGKFCDFKWEFALQRNSMWLFFRCAQSVFSVAHDETELQFGARNESLRTKLKTPRNQAKIYNCGKKLERNFSSLTVSLNIELAGSELTFQINLSHSIWCTLKLVIIFYGFW